MVWTGKEGKGSSTVRISTRANVCTWTPMRGGSIARLSSKCTCVKFAGSRITLKENILRVMQSVQRKGIDDIYFRGCWP